MTPFLLYIARAGLYLALFYAFYLLVMRRATFFRLNRVLLLAGSYLCLILPLFRIRTVSASGITSGLIMVAEGQAVAEEAPVAPAFPWKEALLCLFIAGAAVTLARYLISALKMSRIIRSGEAVKRDGCSLVLLEGNSSSFSWGNKVVMSRQDLAENPAIFTHELMHVRNRHSVDLVLFFPLQLLFWWNPLVWITREELRLVHEYEADEGVIQNGIDATQYQLLLVRKAVGEHRFSLASGFQHAKLKNRIEMMLKPSSSGWMRWSYLALVPVLAACMFACNPAKNSNNQAADSQDGASPADAQYTTIVADEAVPQQEAIPYNLIENKPLFNGGDANNFSLWVNSQLKYPEELNEAAVEGRLVLQFTVGADGVVRDVEVLKSVNELLDAEAVKVVSASPRWEPGQQDGSPVPVKYIFPIIFKVQ